MEKKDDPVIRTSLSLRASVWREIEKYAGRRGFVTTADAVRQLLRDALDDDARKARK